MAMDYTTFVASLSNLMATDPTTPEFAIFLPDCITYAEKRIYRELDILDSVWAASATLTADNRVLQTPAAAYGNFITIQGVNVLSYAPNQRVQLQPVSVSFLNAVYGAPGSGLSGIPQYFAMFRQDTMVFGPWPDQDYAVEILGTYRPEPLSETNPTTPLTIYYPDVFLAASMIFASGYMRDFGAQSDNPAQSQSWESQYQALMKGAELENLRAKFAGPGWTSLSSTPVAPSR